VLPRFPPEFLIRWSSPEEVSFPADWAGCEARANASTQHPIARPAGLRCAYRRKSSKPLSHSHTIARDNMAFWPRSANGVARMKKILIGLVAAIVIATVGFFGFEFYVQRRVAGEVEAAFDQIRATGSKASHGKVSLARWKTLNHIDLTNVQDCM
jgi:hypothetical protein